MRVNIFLLCGHSVCLRCGSRRRAAGARAVNSPRNDGRLTVWNAALNIIHMHTSAARRRRQYKRARSAVSGRRTQQFRGWVTYNHHASAFIRCVLTSKDNVEIYFQLVNFLNNNNRKKTTL